MRRAHGQGRPQETAFRADFETTMRKRYDVLSLTLAGKVEWSSRMQWDFTTRWPVLGALRSGIRRLLPLRLTMPVLQTERVKLRSFDQKDFKEIVALGEFADAQSTDSGAREFLDHCFREYRERRIGPWAIELKQTGAIVGNCGFPDLAFRKHCGEINYYIGPQHRGQGLAPEASKALLAFGFSELGLTRIQARCNPDNLSSERVMQKLGMNFEGFVEPTASSPASGPKQKLYAILRNDFHMKSKHTVHLAIKIAAQPGSRTKSGDSA